jgi:hypothetical protein
MKSEVFNAFLGDALYRFIAQIRCRVEYATPLRANPLCCWKHNLGLLPRFYNAHVSQLSIVVKRFLRVTAILIGTI